MTMSEYTRIPSKARARVRERDSYDGVPCCIFCGSPYGVQIAHYVPRSRGGMGIETNLACLCSICHAALDNGSDLEKAEEIRSVFRAHLEAVYPGWEEERQVYRR